ncbi:MAG TPA: DNA recombination protein RmuC [Holophagaceae bacterium]|nr:DNA recombination protein RmuC [Holophagaceae bacterium]
MTLETILLVLVAMLALAAALGAWRKAPSPVEEMRRLLEAQQAQARQDGQATLAAQLNPVQTQLMGLQAGLAAAKSEQETALLARFQDVQAQLGQGLQGSRTEQAQQLEGLRASLTEALGQSRQELSQRLDAVQTQVQQRLQAIQEANEQKLEQMRLTVDEKLHATLEKRLGESFSLVAERLEAVQKGLGEMQNLANDVGGLKRALTNVKSRGVMGEAQLAMILEQFLDSRQYQANVKIRPRSAEVVEFAVKLPGAEEGQTVWLPIDAKFPIEDYQRLLDAYELVDVEGIATHGKALEDRLWSQARDIRDKYIAVPHSTDFALLFLPFEGLYAEALRRPGLFEKLQRECKVTLVGPTTLTAFLNSLQVGFKTLAITKQSSEVWKVLGNVKYEFGKFGAVLESVQKQLETASNKLSDVAKRKELMEKALVKVEAAPETLDGAILPSLGTSED